MRNRSTRAAKKPARRKPAARKKPASAPAPATTRIPPNRAVPVAPATKAGPSVVDGKTDVVAYAWGGVKVDPADPSAIAKSSYDPASGETRYWLKRSTYGRDTGLLFNPQSPTHDPRLLTSIARQLGRSRYEFKRATRSSFELYLKYIQPPHNPLNLRGAERNN